MRPPPLMTAEPDAPLVSTETTSGSPSGSEIAPATSIVVARSVEVDAETSPAVGAALRSTTAVDVSLFGKRSLFVPEAVARTWAGPVPEVNDPTIETVARSPRASAGTVHVTVAPAAEQDGGSDETVKPEGRAIVARGDDSVEGPRFVIVVAMVTVSPSWAISRSKATSAVRSLCSDVVVAVVFERPVTRMPEVEPAVVTSAVFNTGAAPTVESTTTSNTTVRCDPMGTFPPEVAVAPVPRRARTRAAEASYSPVSSPAPSVTDAESMRSEPGT